MALTAALGLVTGTRDEISLPITVWDTGLGTIDRDAALAYVEANAPTTVLGCEISDSISITERSAGAIVFSVAYKRRGKNTYLRRANIAARSKKIHHFLAAGNVYGVSGADETSTNVSLKWKPDRQGKAEEFNSGKALSVDPYGETRAFDIITTSDMMSDAFLDAMEDLVGRGCFNADPQYGKAEKSLQFVRFTATERETNDWEISCGFAYVPTQTNVDVGDGVQIPSLVGTDYYYPVEREVYDDADIQPKVVKVVVGQAWPTGDFRKIPQTGTLTTRSSNTAGVITTPYAHSIASGNVDVFWDGGYRLGGISSTGTLTITFSGGSGDDLPVAGSNVIIKQP